MNIPMFDEDMLLSRINAAGGGSGGGGSPGGRHPFLQVFIVGSSSDGYSLSRTIAEIAEYSPLVYLSPNSDEWEIAPLYKLYYDDIAQKYVAVFWRYEDGAVEFEADSDEDYPVYIPEPGEA